ncbi:hypothetical protein [Acidiphilium sp. PM]|uniref:hypothetical protein n=1 Tax=Acidiphilium sp. PM TaxID=1043206 RepID=UPI0002144A04|nr:hypothetical protein [Acidiphilium sp. PM]EGO96878.1 hypothetical protein APM_0212 [Acidiphilium sp. PM]
MKIIFLVIALGLVAVVVPGGARAQEFVAAPPVPHARGALTGIVLENTTHHALSPHLITFATMFPKGALPRGVGIQTGTQPAQADVKLRYPDGSAKFAVITLRTPPIAAAADAGLLLRASGHAARGIVAIAPVLAAHPITIHAVITPKGGATQTFTIDISHWYRRAKAAGRLSPWLQGPLAHQVRLSRTLVSSLRLVVDLTAYRSGAIGADIQFDNDRAMTSSGGAMRETVSISIGGKTIYRVGPLTEHQYQDWHVVLRTNGRVPINVVHDIAALERLGAIPHYELHPGAARSVLIAYRRAIMQPGWDAPLAADGVTKYMPTTGGRGSIGPTTRANAVWLISQNPIAAEYAIGQADAAGAVPWHMWYPKAGNFLTTADFPDIWTDPRGGPHSYTTGLTQQVGNTGWTPDASHQPDLAYIPYLLTGRRYYLDQLNAQASFAETDFWPAAQARNGGEGIVVGSGNQLRGAAWDLREIAEAAYIDPQYSVLRQYFARMVANNMAFLLRKLPLWQAREGEAYGYLPGEYRVRTVTPPWQQDFFAIVMSMLAQHHVAGARAVLLWQTHFLANSLLPLAQGFNPHDGIVYNLAVYNANTNRYYSSWSAIRQATREAGEANGNGWKNSNGYYAQTRLAALAGVANTTDSVHARAAYAWLAHAHAPFTSTTALAQDSQYWITPTRHP